MARHNTIHFMKGPRFGGGPNEKPSPKKPEEGFLYAVDQRSVRLAAQEGGDLELLVALLVGGEVVRQVRPPLLRTGGVGLRLRTGHRLGGSTRRRGALERLEPRLVLSAPEQAEQLL